MILALGAVVLLVVVVLGLTLSLTSSRSLGGTALLVIGGGGLLLAVGGAVVVVGIGLGGGGDDDAAPPAATDTTTVEPTKRARATTSTSTKTTSTSTTTTTTTGRRGDALDARGVAMRADTADAYGAPLSVVDRLPPRSVLLVTATGFEPNATGVIEQCTVTGCGNPFPVVFGGGGSARLQYLVAGEIMTGPGAQSSCGPADPSRVVRISGGDAAYLATVFGGVAPPPPAVTVESLAGGIVDGQLVRVSVTGFRPGERLKAMLCAAPASHGSARCGAPGAVAPFTVAADGSGRTSLVVRRGPVGTERVACGRDAACGVVVSPEQSFVPNPVFVLRFAAGPGAAYNDTRLLTGLLLAALLLIVAWFIARSTDRRKPTEADTPELDRAVL